MGDGKTVSHFVSSGKTVFRRAGAGRSAREKRKNRLSNAGIEERFLREFCRDLSERARSLDTEKTGMVYN